MKLTPKIAATLLTVGMLTAGGLVAPALAAPSADSLTLYLKRSSRQVVDLGPTGTSVGDMAFATGAVSAKRGGPATGTYNFRGITVAVGIPGGRESRDALIQVELKNGLILFERINSVPQGTLPDNTEVYPVTGGTGSFAGVGGTAAVTALSDSEYKVVFRFSK